MHENFLGSATAETKDTTLKYRLFCVRKVSWCPSRAGHCGLVLLINSINSSTVITHKSTIINKVSSQCRHSLTSSRFSHWDLCRISFLSLSLNLPFLSAWLKNIRQVSAILWAPLQLKEKKLIFKFIFLFSVCTRICFTCFIWYFSQVLLQHIPPLSETLCFSFCLFKLLIISLASGSLH